MLRKDIKAGVIYATESKYGRPSPIVFLEDGAATLFGTEPYGRGIDGSHRGRFLYVPDPKRAETAAEATS